MKADLLHALEKLRRRRESLYGGGEVGIGSFIAGDQPSDPRQDCLEVHVVDLTDQAARLTKIENSTFPARP